MNMKTPSRLTRRWRPRRKTRWYGAPLASTWQIVMCARSNMTRLFGYWSRPNLIRNRRPIFKNASQVFENNDVNGIRPRRFHENSRLNSRINSRVKNRPEFLCQYSEVGGAASPQRKNHSGESR